MNATPAQIRVGVKTLRYYRGFIRSDAQLARKPFDPWESVMTKREAQDILWGLLDRKINERGQVKETRKMRQDYQANMIQDARTLREIGERVRHYSFATEEVRKRFSHLLSTQEP